MMRKKLKVTHKNKILHVIYLESFIVKLYSPTLQKWDVRKCSFYFRLTKCGVARNDNEISLNGKNSVKTYVFSQFFPIADELL